MNRAVAYLSTCLVASQLIGCVATQDDFDVSSTESEIVQVGESNLLCSDLIAGKRHNAGEVCVAAEGPDLIVTYTTKNGWVLGQAHAWAGPSAMHIPQNRKGEPKLSEFNSSGDITGATSHSVSFPLSDFGLTGDEIACDPTSFFVSAHADVLRDKDGDGYYEAEKSAWGAGKRFKKRGLWQRFMRRSTWKRFMRRGNRGTYFSGKLECSDDGSGSGGGGDDGSGGGAEPGEKNCETAFAFGGDDATCFRDIDEDGDGKGDFNRWGWSNGPLGCGTFSWDLIAGAGQCDINKGTVVGTVTVDSDGYSMSVTVNLDAPYTMEDAQLYVGGEILPRNNQGEFTVAPGQYPHVEDFDNDPSTYTFSNIPASGHVNVVVHTTVCGFGGDDGGGGDDSGPPGQPEIIVDNHDHHQELPSTISFTGFWDKASGATGHYGLTGLFANTGGEIDTYRFTPEFTGSGNYRVMVWNNCFSPRANNVPHTIVFDGGSTTIEVDQDCATGSHTEWFELGTFPFAAGTSGYLEISDEGLPAGSFIGVDAVRFLREDAIVIEESDPEATSTGEWSEASAATEHHGLTSLFAHGSVLSTYRFTPTISEAGSYEVFVWNSCFSPREGQVPHTVVHAAGSTTINVDQDCVTGSHGEFFSLGVFAFDAGTSGYLEISNEGTDEFGFIGADAVLFSRANAQ